MGKKIREIERLRGLAVLMVMFAHIHFLQPYVHPLFRQSWTGVDLFFVISGFVVCLSLFKYFPDLEKEGDLFRRLKEAAPALKRFFVRRVYRILPLALLWSFIPLAISVLFRETGVFGEFKVFESYKEFFAILTFQYNYYYIFNEHTHQLGHYWSLSVEEHFYIILPFLLVLIPSDQKRMTYALIAVGLIAFAIRPLIPYTGPADAEWAWIRFASHNRFDSLFLGVVIALLFKKGLVNFHFSKPWLPNFIAVLCLALMWLLPGATDTNSMEKSQLVVLMFLAAALVFLAAQGKGYVFEIPAVSTLLEWMGARSYAIYLIHVPAEDFTNLLVHLSGREISNEILLALWLLITFTLVEISHQLIEKPLIKVARGKTQ